jgi:hypothetical protein
MAEETPNQEATCTTTPHGFGARVKSFYSHPMVGFLGTLVGVVGLCLSWFLYVKGEQKRDLTTIVHPIKTTIVRAGQVPAPLRMTFRATNFVRDITAAQIAVWNQGNLAIEKADILQPITIATSNDVPILDATLRKVSRDVTHVTLITNNLAAGKLGVEWDILEQQDGCIIQIMYAGDESVDVHVDGVIKGQKQGITPRRFPQKILSPEQQLAKLRNNRPSVIFLFVAAIPMLCSGILVYLGRKSGLIERFLSWLILGCTFGILLTIIYNWALATRDLGPPFGF